LCYQGFSKLIKKKLFFNRKKIKAIPKSSKSIHYPSHRDNLNFVGTSPQEDLCTLTDSCSGGKYIIHKANIFSINIRACPNPKGCPKISSSLFTVKTSLRQSISYSYEDISTNLFFLIWEK